MARQHIYTGRWATNRYSAASNITKYNNRLLDIQARFVAAVDPTKCQISDWFRFTNAQGGSAGFDAFLIRFMSSSVLTGREVLAYFPRQGTAGAQEPFMGVNWCNGADGSIDDYWQQDNDALAFANVANASQALHYNESTKDNATSTILNSMTITATASGGTPVAGGSVYKRTGAQISEGQFVLGIVSGGPTYTITLQMKRGRKPRVAETFSNGTITLTIASITHDEIYDFAFDNWDTGKYALPITASGGAGTFTEGETVTATGGGTGYFRRETGGIVYLADQTGTFTGTLTGGTSGATRTITALGNSNFTTPVANSFTLSRSPHLAADFVTFFPLRARLPGVVIYERSTAFSTSPCTLSYVIDDSKPFVALYHSDGKNPIMNSIICVGEIITPYLIADTKKSGTMYQVLTNSFAVGGTVLRSRINAYSGEVATPTPINNLSSVQTSIWTIDNAPRKSDDLFNWDNVSLYNSTEQKGFLDNAVFRIAGAAGDHIGLTPTGPDGPFVKMGTTMLWPWVTSEPLVSTPRWGSTYTLTNEPGDDLY